MPIDQILTLLIQERTKIDAAIAALQGTPRLGGRPRKNAVDTSDDAPTPNHTRKRRRWTRAMKLAARERSNAMWAAKRRQAAKKG